MKLYYKSMKNLLLLYLIIKENLKTDLPNTNIHSKTNLKEMQPIHLSIYAWDKQINTQTEIK